MRITTEDAIEARQSARDTVRRASKGCGVHRHRHAERVVRSRTRHANASARVDVVLISIRLHSIRSGEFAIRFC